LTDFATQIDIREAGTTDAEALARVGAESFAATYSATTTPGDIAAHVAAHFSAGTIREAMAQSDCHYFLASVDSQPAGILKLRSNQCPDPVPDPNAIELQLLYILPAFQRFGLGRRLVDVAIQKTTALGRASIWLSAWEGADWAINFYTKVGFQKVGTQAFKVGQTAYTDLLLWRPVD